MELIKDINKLVTPKTFAEKIAHLVIKTRWKKRDKVSLPMVYDMMNKGLFYTVDIDGKKFIDLSMPITVQTAKRERPYQIIVNRDGEILEKQKLILNESVDSEGEF